MVSHSNPMAIKVKVQTAPSSAAGASYLTYLTTFMTSQTLPQMSSSAVAGPFQVLFRFKAAQNDFDESKVTYSTKLYLKDIYR